MKVKTSGKILFLVLVVLVAAFFVIRRGKNTPTPQVQESAVQVDSAQTTPVDGTNVTTPNASQEEIEAAEGDAPIRTAKATVKKKVTTQKVKEPVKPSKPAPAKTPTPVKKKSGERENLELSNF